MKKLTILGLLSIGVFTMALSSCSEDLTPTTSSSDKSIQMTVYASREDISTRTLLEEIEGNLACAWEQGDQLLVTNAEGGKLGYLTLTDADKGQFDGSLVGISGDHMTLNYFYLGHDTNLEKVSGSYTLDFASQSGTLDACGDNDLLSAQANVAVIEDKAYVEGTLNLKRFITFAHFQLNFPDGVKMTNGTVTINGDNVMTKSSFGLKDRIISEKKSGTITVSNTNGDFYICLIPADAVALSFNATVNGVNYEGNLTAKDIAEGVYLRKAVGEGVPVEMKGTVDHSKNPLLKWAETNLVYNKSTKKSSFATNATDNGSHYQWGRNVGFKDYLEARGTKNTSTNSYNYYVVEADKFVHAGLDAPIVDSEGYIDVAGPKGEITNVSDLKDYKDFWIMNASTSRTNKYKGDYYAGENGGNTWKDRADKQGYKMDDLISSSEWRLPTSNDFKEIMPKININSSNSLSHELENLVEIKTNSECTYAIRWSKVGYALQIDAVVVESGTTSTKNIDWSKKVTRIFPLAGVIRSTTYESMDYSGNYDVYLPYISVPTPLCDLGLSYGNKTFTDYSIGGNVAYTFVKYAKYDQKNDNSNNYGAYWVSDSKTTFTIVDNASWAYAPGATATQSTQFSLQNQNAHNGYSIRLIKNN